MKKIITVPGFSKIDDLLTKSLETIRQGLLIKIEAAKKISEELLVNNIHDEDLFGILKLPVFLEEHGYHGYDLIKDELTDMTLLWWLCCIGINQSQTGKRPEATPILIRKSDMDIIGYKPGQRFDKESAKIKNDTGGFIYISPYNSSAKNELFSFSTYCYFTIEFPEKIPIS